VAKAQIPVGTVRAAQHGTYGAASWVNVYYFGVLSLSPTIPHVINDVAEAVKDLYASGLGDTAFVADFGLTYCTVGYRSADDTLTRHRVPNAWDGVQLDLGQDAQVAYLLNWATNDPRRGGKARQYICGVAQESIDDSVSLKSTFVSGRNGTIATWLENLPTGPYTNGVQLELVEMSFRDGKAWRDTPLAYTIFDGTLNPVVASQRRRVDRQRPA